MTKNQRAWNLENKSQLCGNEERIGRKEGNKVEVDKNRIIEDHGQLNWFGYRQLYVHEIGENFVSINDFETLLPIIPS